MPKPNHRSAREAAALASTELTADERSLVESVISYVRELAPVPGATQAHTTNRSPWARLRQRRNQVVVLDGHRGTGKTSLLMTIVKHWVPADAGGADFVAEHDELVRSLAVLDFDPMPIGMSVHGWLLQPWGRLVDWLTQKSCAVPGAFGSRTDDLSTTWQRLVDAAVTGWLPSVDANYPSDALIAENERLGKYFDLQSLWFDFVKQVFERLGQIGQTRLLVIPIDDVDLQIGRNIELLHALRLFEHPQVVYLLTADLEHTRDILALHYEREHRNVGGVGGDCDGESPRLEKISRDSRQLALFQAQKAFPESHQVRRLSLHDIFAVKLGDLPAEGNLLRRFREQLGLHLDKWFQDWVSWRELGATDGILTFRDIQQRLERCERAATGDCDLLALQLLLDGPTEVDSAFIRPTQEPDSQTVLAYRATGNLELDSKVRWRVGEPNRWIYVGGTVTGTLRRDGANGEPRVEGQARFANHAVAAALAAETNAALKLRGRLRGGGIRPDAQRLFVWTDWTSAPVHCRFLWPLAPHPDVSKLGRWLRQWSDRVRRIEDRPADEIPLHLVVLWFMCQVDWTGADTVKSRELWERYDSLVTTAPKTPKPFTSVSAMGLLRAVSEIAEQGQRADKVTGAFYLYCWSLEFAPLFAAPEIGLPECLQQIILEVFASSPSGQTIKRLTADRRQAVIDAIYTFDRGRNDHHEVEKQADEFISHTSRAVARSAWDRWFALGVGSEGVPNAEPP